MKLYYKREKDNVSRIRLYSYIMGIIGLISMIFYSMVDSERAKSETVLFMAVSFVACAVFAAIDLYKEIKTRQSCNVYDLIRAVFSCALCVVSLTCIDVLLG